jgi:hypothetical protein
VIVRGIRAAIRDQDWRTLTPTVTAVHDDESAGARDVRLNIDYAGWGQTYSAVVTLRLTERAAVVRFDGTADAAFRGNRVGLVVLHDPAVAGDAVSVTSPDGATTASEFPVQIQPHQPFMNIAGMRWAHDGAAIDLRFAGDIFETEDQRNWTDASYKTYSTPLALPFPVEHPAGSTVHQSVTVTVDAGADADADAGADTGAGADTAAPVHPHEPADQEIVITDDVVGRIPAIGLSASTDPNAHAPHAPIAGLDALLVELTGTIDQRRKRLADARAEASALKVPLDLRIVADSAAELAASLELVDPTATVRLGVFDPVSHVTEPALWAALKAEAAQRGFDCTLVAGARSHFTELNRTIERLQSEADGIVFSMTPQMHASEVERIVQTLPMQRLVAENALRLGGGRALHIGPITLKPRFNAVATRGGYDEATRTAMITDELQPAEFTAAWTLGSIAPLSSVGGPGSGGVVRDAGVASDGAVVGDGGVAGDDIASASADTGHVASVSYFETSGARGIDAVDGAQHPVGGLIRALAALRGRPVLRTTGDSPGTDDPLIVVPVRSGETVTIFMANLSHDARTVTISSAAQTSRVDLAAWATQTIEHAAIQHAAIEHTAIEHRTKGTHP